jgi:hypothetical protein
VQRKGREIAPSKTGRGEIPDTRERGLDVGGWGSEAGVWDPDVEVWGPDSRVWGLDVGVWSSGAGMWGPNAGHGIQVQLPTFFRMGR